MKTVSIRSLAIAALTLVSASAFAENAEAQAALAEIKQSFGVVPTPFRLTPEDSIAPLWGEFKALELNPNTSLNGKQKELIGLAVAAQIPCQYCTYMHGEAAKLNGATPAELKEAITVAAVVRHWTTFVDGQADETAPKQGALPPDVEATYKDVEKTMGAVPPFIKRFPVSSISAAWKLYKGALMGSSNGLTPKDRALIAVAVSAQVPSTMCVKSYSAMAKQNGATDAELSEALGISSLTRAGSTVLNGNLVDPVAFRAETDAMFRFIKKSMKKETAAR